MLTGLAHFGWWILPCFLCGYLQQLSRAMIRTEINGMYSVVSGTVVFAHCMVLSEALRLVEASHSVEEIIQPTSNKETLKV